MTVFLGTLWSSIKEVKALFKFDVKHGNALLAVQWNRTSSHDRGKSQAFSQVAAGTWGFITSYDGDVLETLMFSQQRQDSCLVSMDTSGFSSSLARAVGTPLKLRRETQCPFPVATEILEFLSIFKRSRASSPVEACSSTFLWRCQRGIKGYLWSCLKEHLPHSPSNTTSGLTSFRQLQ